MKQGTHAALGTGVHGVGASTVESIAGSASKVSTHAAILTSVHGFDETGNAPAQVHGSSRHTGTIGDHTTNLSNVGSNTHAQIDTAVTASAGHIATSSAHGTAGNIVGTSDNQSLTNKTITDSTNNVTAKSLKSATTTIDVSASSAPITGQVLTAISSTAATWQTQSTGTVQNIAKNAVFSHINSGSGWNTQITSIANMTDENDTTSTGIGIITGSSTGGGIVCDLGTEYFALFYTYKMGTLPDFAYMYFGDTAPTYDGNNVPTNMTLVVSGFSGTTRAAAITAAGVMKMRYIAFHFHSPAGNTNVQLTDFRLYGVKI